MYIFEEIYSEDWLTRLWRLRSPTICHLQDGDPRKSMLFFKSKSDVLEARRASNVSPSTRAGEDIFQFKETGRKQKGVNSSFLHLFILVRPPVD